MLKSIIVAIGKQQQIGLDNKLLWKLAEDLKFFKKTTKGHHILMGRKTFQSIGRPLPNRVNVIITRDRSYKQEGCLIFHSLEVAFSQIEKAGEDEVFICGGEEIYRQTLAISDKLYITNVDFDGKADTFFPDYKQLDIALAARITL